MKFLLIAARAAAAAHRTLDPVTHNALLTVVGIAKAKASIRRRR